MLLFWRVVAWQHEPALTIRTGLPLLIDAHEQGRSCEYTRDGMVG